MTHQIRSSRLDALAPRVLACQRRNGCALRELCADVELLPAFAIRGICHSDEPVSWGLSACLDGRAPETVAATDDVAVRATWLQHQLQQGPDVTATRSQLVVSKDLGADARWPDFGSMCVAVLGLRSMISIAIPVPEGHASMNYLSADPAAFDHFDVDAALRLANRAAVSVAGLLPAVRAVHGEMPDSDFSKVAVAMSLVMAQRHMSTVEALALLRQTGRATNACLFGVATDVVRLGRLTDPVARDRSGARPRQRSLRIADDEHPPLHVGGPDIWHTPCGAVGALSPQP